MRRPRHTRPEPAPRDRYPDALRAMALLVVVFGHWIATLPRLDEGLMVATDHLLAVWEGAGMLTWVVQVVPLFVFVSAAVSADGVNRRLYDGHRQLHWWASRALALARPTVTYLAVLGAVVLLSGVTGGRFLEPLNHSLTIHLWFLLMLLGVQALLPLSVRADHRWGLGAVAGMVAIAALVDLMRARPGSAADLLRLGELATDHATVLGWLNLLVVWLLPQQLGIAWRQGRFAGTLTGLALCAMGLGWLALAVGSGYPLAMVDGEVGGRSNLLPPTLALMGVMWLQVGTVLAFESPARRLLARRSISRAVTILGALGMPLYLWHKFAELPAAWLGEKLGAPIDAGLPGEAGFWWGRLVWLLLCALMVTPVMAAVVAFEMRRRRDLVSATGTRAILAGGVALFAGILASMALGAMPGALLGLAGVVVASWLLRAHPQPRLAPDQT
ncbi:acyltransferase family protein [Halomonas ventosae]|uniref:Acyltransferase-like protein n=1 Tax=Halomonas ventosae TaxID=229007 RepID=A0A2T0VCC3_9GAMM|nr:acyltransferase [Halomonas ventosae]PRY67815.1 acyltransferase-like protein [Halomonas ventosae]